MPRFIIAIIVVAIMAVPCFAQVDTLMLVEDSNIEIIDDIHGLYTEDLNNDEVHEIILCTDHFIYTYESANNELIWTSPVLTNPQDLLFKDINHDGLLDISVKDSLNIYLFDPHNYSTIWTSPVLDSTYKCYTIGDLNEDNWDDIVIARQLPYDWLSWYPSLRDTATVTINYGPFFDDELSFNVITSNYHYDGTNGLVLEDINKLIVATFTQENETNTMLYVLSLVNDTEQFMAIFLITYSGRTWLVNPHDFSQTHYNNIGVILDYVYISVNDSSQLIAVSYKSQDDVFCDWYSMSVLLNTFTAEAFSDSETIWSIIESTDRHLWKNYVIGEVSPANYGQELCFGAEELLYLFDLETSQPIWTSLDIENLHSVKYIFKSQNIFESPAIICKLTENENRYVFYEGSSGELAAILQCNNSLSKVTDLNFDGNDEILSIDYNTLRIYHLEYYVDIDQPATVPYQTFLQPNYPNPFNAATTIEYGLNQPGQITIEIYDLLGRRVETLVNETKPAGLYQATWQAKDMPSGVYFYKIETGDYTKTRKMMLLK